MPRPGRPSRSTRSREELGRAVVLLLARTRREAGLTRQKLATLSGISPNTIAKIESVATTDPGFTVVAVLADALGMPLDLLARTALEEARSSGDVSGVAPRRPVADRPESTT